MLTTHFTESLHPVFIHTAANFLQRCVVLCAVPAFLLLLFMRCTPARQWHPPWADTAQVHLSNTLLDSGTLRGPKLFRVFAQMQFFECVAIDL